jgi:hypothetical protein
MAITFSTTPSEIPTPSSARYNYWQMPVTPLSFYYYQGGQVPAPFSQYVTMRDVIGTSVAEGYTEFKYKTFLQVSPNFNILTFTGPLATGGSLVTYENGLQGTHNFSFQNLNLLQPGTYTITVMHQIWGNRGTQGNFKMDERSFVITLSVFSSNVPVVTPSSAVDITWVMDTNTLLNPGLSTEITISGSFWSINSPAGFFWRVGEGDATVYNPTSWGGGNITGNGTATATLMMSLLALPENITQNPILLSLSVNGGIIEIPLRAFIVQSSGLFLEKTALFFSALRGIEEAEALTVLMRYDGNYTLVYPSWITLSQVSGSGTITVEIRPIGSLNLEAGTYTGDILVKNAAGNTIGTVHVTYQVNDAVILPYTGGLAFTLDNLFTRFHSIYAGAYFEMKLRVKVNGFDSQEYVEKPILTFKLPLFKGTQKINIGAPVHRLMERMATLDVHYDNPYKPAEVYLDVTEYRGETTEVYNLGPLNFIAGLKPEMASGFGFLDINAQPKRAMATGYQIVNMVISGNVIGKIIRNNAQVKEYALSPGIRSEILDFEALGAVQGDVWDFVIFNPETGDSLKKTFIIFPEGYTSLTVIWEDEYRLRQVMQFTGKYKLKNTFEHISQDLERDNVPFLDKIRTAKTGKFTLNTGWILKTDKISLESLCRATNALLITPNGNIRIQPIPADFAAIDIDETTVSYDIDFQINRSYDEEIHLF